MYRFDLHIHSLYSYDSMLSPALIIKIAVKRGLNAIAITDHNSIKGGIKAKNIKDKNITIIIGSEIKTDCGDLIGLYLNDDITNYGFLDVIEEIRKQDGIAILPHPLKRKVMPTTDMLKKVDLFEGINGRTSNELNHQGLVLAKSIQKRTIAGSDSHYSYEIGRVYNSISYTSSEEDLRKNLSNMNIQVHGTPLVKIFRVYNTITGEAIKRVIK
ncbi:MAG: PHP domain-containing protein [Dehalobacter sp.]|nr:PHP domain-containing protein [Dehalobacter sp.]